LYCPHTPSPQVINGVNVIAFLGLFTRLDDVIKVYFRKCLGGSWVWGKVKEVARGGGSRLTKAGLIRNVVSIINVTPGCMFSFSSVLLAIVTFKPSIDITKEEFTSLTEFASRVDIGFDFTSFIA
jgi:hypothetical protein